MQRNSRKQGSFCVFTFFKTSVLHALEVLRLPLGHGKALYLQDFSKL
ncbi:hypothetical protein [uncultured Pontibacter sp.]|nr:hypothetical protein [uncultured Pontibacter sp.]